MLFSTALVAAAAVNFVSGSPAKRDTASTISAVLPLRRNINVSSIANIVSKGQNRINNINGGVFKRQSGTVTNDDVSYVAPVVIGGSTYDLIVDTGCKSIPLEDLGS